MVKLTLQRPIMTTIIMDSRYEAENYLYWEGYVPHSTMKNVFVRYPDKIFNNALKPSYAIISLNKVI